MYLLAYAPEKISEELLKSPNLAYDDPKTKSRPHVVVLPAGAPAIKAEKPFEAAAVAPKAEKSAEAEAAKPATPAAPAADPSKKAKKPKAAQNDDPS